MANELIEFMPFLYFSVGIQDSEVSKFQVTSGMIAGGASLLDSDHFEIGGF